MGTSKRIPPATDAFDDKDLFEDRFLALGRATGSMVWRVGPTGLVADMPDWSEVTGQPIEDSRNAGWLLRVHPDDRQRTNRIWQDSIRSQTPYEADYRLKTADGSYRWFKARGVPILNRDGTIREWVGLCEDIHERTLTLQEQEESKQALRQSEERYRQTFDHAAVGIAHVGLDGRWLRFNDALCLIVGYSREELLGLSFADITHPHDLGEDWAQARRLASGEINTYTMEKRYVRKCGRIVWVNLTVSLMRDRDGNPQNYISIVEDVDARKRFEENLERLVEERTAALNEANAALTAARDAAVAASKTKSEFLANMSHEIRTPMNGVIGLTSLLLQMELNPNAKHMVETIASSGETLLRVIDDILDLSRIEAAKLEIERTSVSIDQLCLDVVALFQGHAKSKDVDLKAVEPECKTPNVLADSVRLRQILSNLIANGVKFTERGEVTLGWKWEQADGVIRVTFSVTDTGTGIPEDRTEAVFESFTQADGSTQRRFGGTGLGLTISKRLVELMDGKIAVQSTVGAGTTFHVYLAFEQAGSATADAKHAETVENERFEDIRVLLAEDNPVNILVASHLLEHCGCQVEVADNGLRAISMAAGGEFDLILMDVQMPVCDGLEATRVIRMSEARDGRKRLPVYALTANVMSGDREECLAAGMDGFLAKPILLSALQAILKGVRSAMRKG